MKLRLILVNFIIVLGNHDYMGDVLAQLSDEIVKRDPRWFCRREFQLHPALCKGSAPGTF